MAVGLSVGGQTLYETQGAPEEVLVATLDGVVSLSRPSPNAAWGESGRSLTGKHISTILVEPSRGTVLAGTHGEGIYASEDGGKNWERRDQGVASPNIYSMNFVQTGGQLKLYAGTEPAHLYVSSDLGKSWTELPTLRSVPSVEKWTFPGEPHEGHVKHINFDPRSADTIYASIEVGAGLKSTDAGRTWQEMSGFDLDVHRIIMPRTAPDRLYITGGDGIYHSQDAGKSWMHLTDRNARIAYPDALLAHPRNPDLIFTAGAICSPGDWRKTHDADSRIGRSRDAGKTWQYLEGGLPAHIRGNIEAMSMVAWPSGFSLIAGTTDGEVFISEDEGEHWQTISQALPPVSKGGHYVPLTASAAR